MDAFNKLNRISVKDHVEQKNGLSYLPWAWAWAELKKAFPASFYTVYENRDGLNYHTDGRTCWVKTGVTVVDGDERLEHIEYLPVMDFKNRSIPANAVTSFDVNKAIQRSLTKAVARHGLGLYVYSGEDLPEDCETETVTDMAGGRIFTCNECGAEIQPSGKLETAEAVVRYSQENFGGNILCTACMKKLARKSKKETA